MSNFCFDPSIFTDTSKSFNVTSFLEDSQHKTTLSLLQQHCSLLSQQLKQELVDLLNQDYSKFINLSVQLDSTPQDVSDVLEPLKAHRKLSYGLLQQAFFVLSSLSFFLTPFL